MLHDTLHFWLMGVACLGLFVASTEEAKAQVKLTVGDEPGYISEWAEEAESAEGEHGSCTSAWQDYSEPRAARGWVRAEYLTWWGAGNEVPALVTTSPYGTPQSDAGVLGVAGTQVLFGDNSIDGGDRSGLRISAGRWLDDSQEIGLEVVYFSVFDDTGSGGFFGQTGTTSGSPILARPFYDVDQGRENAQLVSFSDPVNGDLVDGRMDISSWSEMRSASILLRRHLRSGPRGRVDMIGGYRYFRFREGIQFQENLVSTDPGGSIPLGTTFDIFDNFTAENDFHGGDLGLVAEFYRNAWTVELLAKVALGNLRRTVNIEGGTTIQTPPPNATTTAAVGGLLALPTNIRKRTDNDFAALPEFGINLGYQATERLSFNFGYTLIMLNDVARSGEQIDRSVNPTYLPGSTPVGAARPQSLFDNVADLWVHGASVGVTFEH
ncbi:MAG: BBP7 family outer membrane beta-barrel protein [Pirellulaceae bacterium]